MDFQNARRLYYDGLKVPLKPESLTNTSYEQCATEGLCFRCKRTDENVRHRPKSVLFGLCPECDAALSIGAEKIERTKALTDNQTTN